jgi:hypothetical protein
MQSAYRFGRAAIVVLAATMLRAPTPLHAQVSERAAPVLSVSLTDGTVLVARLTSQDSIAVTLRSDLLGEFVIPRSAIAGGLEAPAPAAHARDAEHAPPAPDISWSRTVRLGLTYASVQVPGYAGESKGGELSLSVTRNAPLLELTVKVDAAYQHTDPDAVVIDESSMEVAASRPLGKVFSVRSVSLIEHNGVEELDYRLSETLGVGWKPLDTPNFSLQITPGAAYVAEHGDRLDAATPAKFKNAKGLADALFQAMTIRLSEGLSVQQEFQAFHAFDGAPGLQYTGVLRLVGMMSRHIGMTIEYKREFDSTLPYPILQTIERISAGMQVAF